MNDYGCGTLLLIKSDRVNNLVSIIILFPWVVLTDTDRARAYFSVYYFHYFKCSEKHAFSFCYKMIVSYIYKCIS